MQTWDIDQWFNFVEGLWWIGLGIAMLIFGLKEPANRQVLFWGAAILVLFGISDFVEIQTGAWWRPWWLLIWKAGCIIAGLICLMLYFKKRRSL